MITLREIADDGTKISSTRWGWGLTLIFDVVMISLTFAAFITCHVIGKPLDVSFIYAVIAMLGVLTTITGATKALQGFETKKDEDTHKVSEFDSESVK